MSEWLAMLLGFDAFEQPLWLWLGLVLAAAALFVGTRRRARSLDWPAFEEAGAAGARSADPLLWVSRLLRAAALVALAAVLAGPVALRVMPDRESGLDVLLVVDTSGSMRALDARVNGEWRTRLSLAREVVRRFAVQRVAEGDRVGLVVFGEDAFTQCPLTHDGRLLADALERIEAGMAGEATALGDALTLAVKRVAPGEKTAEGHGPGEGRLVVLLTDGRSNAGAVPPDIAAEIAAARRVRVHTVGIGTQGEVPMARPEGGGARGLRFERHDLDVVTLERIAAVTGGRFFHAETSGDLEAVYAEIDALERTPRQARRTSRPRPRPEGLLALAALLVGVEIASTRGLARRIP